MALKRKDQQLQNVKADMNFLERKMLVLNEELARLQKKNEEASIMLKKRGNGGWTFKKMIVVFVVVCVLFALLK